MKLQKQLLEAVEHKQLRPLDVQFALTVAGQYHRFSARYYRNARREFPSLPVYLTPPVSHLSTDDLPSLSWLRR